MAFMSALSLHPHPISVAYIVAAAGLLALAAWSGSGYRRNHSSLTKYLALSGLTASIFFLANSLPFLLTTNWTTLKLATNISDLAYYVTILVQTRLVWYLAFKEQKGYSSLLMPVLVLSGIGYGVSVYTVWHAHLVLSEGVLRYNIPSALLHLDALLDSLFLIVGVYVLKIGRTTTGIKSKWRIFALSLAYIAGGIIGLYNALFVGGTSSSPSVLIVYILVFGLLLVVSLIGRIQNVT